MIPLSVRFAARELRAGVRGFRIFLACLALGVAAIAAASSTAEAFRHGLASQAREILGGDLAGYPNGRRLTDDSTSISLRAVAGAALPLVEPSFVADGAANLLEQGLDPLPIRTQGTFPYVGTPHSGFDSPSETS